MDEGFQSAKGKSRSEYLMDLDEQQSPSKQKLSKDMCAHRMKDIKEDRQDLTDQIKYKDKRIAAYESARDYKKCDEVKEEITILRKQHRQLESEAKRLNKSNTQSKWYFNSKKGKESSIDSSTSTISKSDTSNCQSDGISVEGQGQRSECL